jgi:lipopolysaccharide transport system ATP-binding protein
VAAHLSTEILIIDEVLAVGDAEFQKKCLNKMSDVASAGRTVLFVSHNMNAVQQLCNRVLRLVSGQLVSDTKDVRAGVLGYLMGTQGAGTNLGWVNPGNLFATQDFIPQSLMLVDEQGVPMKDNLQRGVPVFVEITGKIQFPNASLKIGYVLMGSDGAVLYETDCTDSARMVERGFASPRTDGQHPRVQVDLPTGK